MSDNRFGPRREDDELTAMLRQHYAAPVGDAYWADFEARILSRVQTGGGEEWWQSFGRWTGAGLAAAAVAAGIALVVAVHSQKSHTELAYQAVLDTPPSAVQLTAAKAERRLSTSEASLRYVISY
jgi:anti-sigma-K factor RskA